MSNLNLILYIYMYNANYRMELTRNIYYNNFEFDDLKS